MNFTVTTENLLAGLNRVKNAVSTKPVIPILNNILMDAKGDQLVLTAYDTELRIQTTVPAMVTEEGSITLQAKKFCELVGALPAADVVISNTDDEPEAVKIACKRIKYKMHGISAEAFPEAEAFLEDWCFSIDGKELVDSLSKVDYARSEEESRKALSGVLFSIRSGMRTVAATDGRRLALVEKSIDANADGTAAPTRDGEFILPVKVVKELKRSIDQSKPVTIHLTNSMAVFEAGSTSIMSKLVEQSYPNYRSAIPVNFANTVTIPRVAFADSLKRVRIMIAESGDNSGIIKLDIADNQLTFSAMSAEYGDAAEPIDVEMSGEPISIAFNPQFLADPIAALDCEQFVLKYNDALTSALITGDPGFIYILMPMRG